MTHHQIETIDVLQLANGDRQHIQVYKFKGTTTGKKAYIQANLHGAEIIGNGVIYQLIEFFHRLPADGLKGEIWLVPVCNPLGTNQRSHFFATGRFNPYDGKDWNRIFWDYEKECEDLDEFVQSQLHLPPEAIRFNYLNKILTAFQGQAAKIESNSSVPYGQRYGYYLQSLCLDADYLIDIHSSSNQAIDYLYCFHGREESAQYFLLNYGILMTEYDGDAFDEAFLKPWLALEKKFGQLGKRIQFDLESWTLELGSGMDMNPELVQQGANGILNYLSYKEMINLPGKLTPIQLINKTKIKKYYAATGGMIYSRIKLKNQVQAGDLLYQILSFDKKEAKPNLIEVRAEASGLIFDVTNNQSVNQGEYVLGIMESVK